LSSIQQLQSKPAAKIILQVSEIWRSSSPDDFVLTSKEVLLYIKLAVFIQWTLLVSVRNAVEFLNDSDDEHIE